MISKNVTLGIAFGIKGIFLSFSLLIITCGKAQSTPINYSIGDPSDEEQMLLEYINYARANPPAEAIRLRDTTEVNTVAAYAGLGVDKDLMVSQISALPACPPVAFDYRLTNAARFHNNEQLIAGSQGHEGSGGPGARVTREGYGYSALGENAFGTVHNPSHGHAGFEVDWGMPGDPFHPVVGGMQTPPRHRNIIHSCFYKEVGIGFLVGTNGNVGPALITQDFATRSGPLFFITGVAYYDLNGNNFYDMGEGIGNVRVTVDDVPNYYATTTRSGGYTIPIYLTDPLITSNVTHATVTFSGTNLSQIITVNISNRQNVKVDFKPTYAPTVSGPAALTRDISGSYNISPIGGDTTYQWKQSRLALSTTTAGAEAANLHMIIPTVTNPSIILDTVVRSPRLGSTRSYHLTHSVPRSPQYLEFYTSLRPRSGAELEFDSKFGWGTSSQAAVVEISTDGWLTNRRVWSMSGTSSLAEASFSTKTVNLTQYVGQVIQIRLGYVHRGGQYFNQTTSNIGWNVDNILLRNVDEVTNSSSTAIGNSTSFSFVCSSSGTYLLSARGIVFGRPFPWGDIKVVSVTDPAAFPLPDTTPPGIPSIIPADFWLNGVAQLRWNAVVDTGGSGLQGFRIYRNDQMITTLTGLSYVDITFTPGVYCYVVEAYDGAGNTSRSVPSCLTTTNVPVGPQTDEFIDYGPPFITPPSTVVIVDPGPPPTLLPLPQNPVSFGDDFPMVNVIRAESTKPVVVPPLVKENEVLSVEIYDTRGTRILELFRTGQGFVWDGRMENGKLASSGTYVMFIKTSKGITKKKVSVIR
jgi:hypothetical protein